MKKIIIVDDEPLLKNGIRHLCDWNQYGFEIVGQASNGIEALQVIELTNPDIVITDIEMPSMNGIDLVKNVNEKYPQIHCIILSSYNHFEYVKSAFKNGCVDYFLKPTLKAEELISTLSNLSLEPIKLLKERKVSAPDLKKTNKSEVINLYNILYEQGYIKECEGKFSKPYYMLMKARLDILIQIYTKSTNELTKNISKFIEFKLGRFSHIETINKNEYIILFELEEKEIKEIESAIFLMNVGSSSDLESLVFIKGNTFTSIKEIHKEMEKIDIALNRAFYYYKQLVVSYKEIVQNQTVEFKKECYLYFIKNYKIIDAKEVLLSYVNDAFELKCIDEYEFKNQLRNIVHSTIRTLKSMNIELCNINIIEVFKRIDLSYSKLDFTNVISQILNSIEQQECIENRSNNKQLLNDILEYVEANYKKEITLSDIATHLHISYYYLSTYFKKNANDTLINYINTIRVEKAKELLHNQELTISEVSNLVGFSDHNYFTKVFRKLTLFTPSVYRKQVIRRVHEEI